MKHPKTTRTEYIEWVEGITKTRKGGLQKPTCRLTQRMFPMGGSRCPVAALEFMVSKRPLDLRSSGPLYLQPLQKPKPDIWFSHQPVGVNTINRYMKDITMQAGLQTTQKNFTNHSMRKTVVKKLKKAGVATRDIAAITGHKSEESLRDYDDNDIGEHRELSKKISNPTASDPGPSYLTAEASYHYNSAYYYPYPPPCTPYLCQPQCTSYQFNNCTVVMRNDTEQKQRKRHMVIYSDDED